MNGSKLIVAALGGNAISRADEEGSVEEQFAHSRATAEQLADLIEAGHQLVITHGNGPQIGNLLLRTELEEIPGYPLPMSVAEADIQGGMGYMIAQTLTNELSARGHDRVVATIITTVRVDPNDPDFANPSKPIGRFYDADQARSLREQKGWLLNEVSAGRFRRIVPSPVPLQIMEIDTIRLAVRSGALLVACGGGGVPVVRDPQAGLRGIPAVIDKDLASGLLAKELGADLMLLLTNVERVALNYGTPEERSIEKMTVSEAERWMDEGQFPTGSMGPKVRGAIEFLKAAGNDRARVIIGPVDRALDTAEGRVGTIITAG